jgi:flagellar biosynthesis/type III secretory pathway M-ring protein FliF/YscJ
LSSKPNTASTKNKQTNKTTTTTKKRYGRVEFRMSGAVLVQRNSEPDTRG